MTKESNTKKESSEKTLIFENKELIMQGKEILKQIFSEIVTLKLRFNELEIEFNEDSFLKAINDGTGFIVDILYSKLTSTYKGIAPAIIVGLIGDKERVQPYVQPIQESCTKIRNLCLLIQLDPITIKLNTDGTFLISDVVKKHLVETFRIYIETPEEKELYSAVLAFLKASNELEKLLKKSDYPLMFTDSLNFIPFDCYELNAENFDETGVWELELNPNIFQNLKNSANARKEFQTNYAPTVSLYGQHRSLDIPVLKKHFDNRAIEQIEKVRK
jgi:hypothetical protein